MHQETKRLALKGREVPLKQFDEKIQRNRVRSANMKNRIIQLKDEFELQAQAKQAALMASLDRSGIRRVSCPGFCPPRHQEARRTA